MGEWERVRAVDPRAIPQFKRIYCGYNGKCISRYEGREGEKKRGGERRGERGGEGERRRGRGVGEWESG